MTLSSFERILDRVTQSHQWIDESEAATRLINGEAHPHPGCWVTFDDGYLDNLTVAAPLLHSRGIRPTLFLTSRVLQPDFRLPVDRWYSVLLHAGVARASEMAAGHLAQPRLSDAPARLRLIDGPGKRRFVASDLRSQDVLLRSLAESLGCPVGCADQPHPGIEYLSRGDIEELCTMGWSVGPHGASHTLLANLTESALRAEINESHAAVEHFSRRSRWLSWPDGAWNPSSATSLAAICSPMGYDGCVSIDRRLAVQGDPAWAMPRVIAANDFSLPI
jgi:peptidoglycan/xylan/chitin deacetylase (PgdA/CDA1 family)